MVRGVMAAREAPLGLSYAGGYPSAFPADCRWAGRHAAGGIDIDLERDDCAQIAAKLERWASVEGRWSAGR